MSSSRFLIPVLCIGAVAYACGSGTRKEASAPKRSMLAQMASGPAAATSQSPRNVVKNDSASVGASLYVHADASAVRLVLHVVNAGSKRVELRFPSGQTYDFVILDSLGREVWRWGSGRMFTQSLRNKPLAGGEALDVEETWNSAALAPGRYTARGMLMSQNFPLTQETGFSVEGSTVAQRN